MFFATDCTDHGETVRPGKCAALVLVVMFLSFSEIREWFKTRDSKLLDHGPEPTQIDKTTI
jgi:hypothetical protein